MTERCSLDRAGDLRAWTSFATSICSIVLSLVISSCRTLRASPQDAVPSQSECDAENAIARGEIALARSDIGRIGRLPQKRLISACLALDEGDAGSAFKLADMVLRTNPGALDATVVAALARERLRHPSQPWSETIVNALRPLGRVQGTEILNCRISSLQPLDDTAITRVHGPFRLLLLLVNHGLHPTPKMASQIIDSVDPKTPLVVRQAIFMALNDVRLADNPGVPGARKKLLAELLKAEPEATYLRVRSATGSDCCKPLTDQELDALDHALDGRDNSLPQPALFNAFQAAYSQVDPGQASEAAFHAVTMLYEPWPLSIVQQRLGATERHGTNAQRAKLPTILEKAGRILLKAHDGIDYNIGIALLMRAGEAGANPRLRAEARMLRASFVHRADMALLVAEGLPSRVVSSEVRQMIMDDEMGLYQRLEP